MMLAPCREALSADRGARQASVRLIAIGTSRWSSSGCCSRTGSERVRTPGVIAVTLIAGARLAARVERFGARDPRARTR